jgi:RHS repeat-associated protein
VDPESQVTSISYSGLPAGVTPIGTTSYSFDVYGCLSLMTDNTGTTGYSSYDDLDEPLLMTRSFTGGPQNQTVAYAHYPDGSRKTLTTPSGVTNPLTGINSGNFTYAYDLAGRLTQQNVPFTVNAINGTAGDYLKQTWFDNGWLKHTENLLMGSGIRESSRAFYTYNARGFLASLTNYQYDPSIGAPNQVSSFNNLTFDAMGNRLTQYTNISAIGSAPNASRGLTFGYDTAHGTASQNRDVLASETSVLRNSGSSLYNDVYANNFVYDPAYSITQFAMSGVTSLFSTNSDNQISNAGFAFDGNGNPTTYQSATFSYDPEDRLTAISSPAFSASYDGNGLRAKKTAGGVTTYFLYDGSTPLLEETFSSPNATITAVNVWAVDGWRARYYPQASEFRAYSFDPQGNVISRQNSGASTYPTYDMASYEAYGKRTADYSPTGINPAVNQDPAGFGGQYGYYTDRETGLLCLTHRYYDPGTGRFVNRDPIGYNGGVNLYGFAGGNPVNFADPSGYQAERSFVSPETEDWIEKAEADGAALAEAEAEEEAKIHPSSRGNTAKALELEREAFLNRGNRPIVRSVNSVFGPVEDLLYGARVGEGLPGSSGVILPQRPTDRDLENLTVKHQVEFELIMERGFFSNGQRFRYVLYSGTAKSVSAPVGRNSVMLLHTQPTNNNPSPADYRALAVWNSVTGQRASRILCPGLPSRRFEIGVRLPRRMRK